MSRPDGIEWPVPSVAETSSRTFRAHVVHAVQCAEQGALPSFINSTINRMGLKNKVRKR